MYLVTCDFQNVVHSFIHQTVKRRCGLKFEKKKCNALWKIRDFSDKQILREINLTNFCDPKFPEIDFT